MPVYELFALLRADLPREKIADVLRRVGTTVHNGNGVLTDLKSYGQQPLAYRINSPAGYQYDAHMVSIYFAVKPEVLSTISYDLRVDERVLRFKLFKQRNVPAYPSPYYIGKALRTNEPKWAYLPYSPITGKLPNEAYKMLAKEAGLPEDSDLSSLSPGTYGKVAGDAYKKMQFQVVPKPPSVEEMWGLPPSSHTAIGTSRTNGPSFASGAGLQPPR